MDKAANLRSQFDEISRRLSAVVVKLEGEQQQNQPISRLSMKNNQSLVFQINIYEQSQPISRQNLKEQSILKDVKQSTTTPSRVRSDKINKTEYKQKKFLEYSSNRKQSTQKQFQNDIKKKEIKSLINSACQTDSFQQKVPVIQTQKQIQKMKTQDKHETNRQFNTISEKEYIFDDSHRRLNFEQTFNLTPEPLSRMLFPHERELSNRSSLNYSRTHMKQTNNSLKQLNKKLNNIYVQHQASNVSSINKSKQKITNQRTFKETGLFGGLQGTCRNKSQTFINKQASYHKKCIQDELNKTSTLSTSRQKNREQFSKKYVQEKPKTEELIGQIRGYLNYIRQSKQYESHLKDRNKSYISYKNSKQICYQHK